MTKWYNLKRLSKNKVLIVTVLVNILLIVAIFYLMGYVQNLLKEDVRINLSEIVTQNKDVVSSKLALELNNLEVDAKQLSDSIVSSSKADAEKRDQLFLDYAKKKGDQSLVFASQNGEAITSGGEKFSVLGRAYFQIGIEGTSNISERLISRTTGEDVFVFCVPILQNDEVIGTIQKQYTPQEMYDICSVSLFSEQGSSYIINRQGYILISSERSQYNKESDNFYRIVYLSDPDSSKHLEDDIKSGRSGFLEATIDGNRVFAAYTPIEQVHDWFLISSISTKAVSPNGSTVVTMFYIILLVVSLFFFVITLYYWYLKRTQQRKLEHIAFVDTVTGGLSYSKFEIDMKDVLAACPDKEFHICTFDIDNFKYINGFYGFATGDRILHYIYDEYSHRLLQNERIARVAADQFIMLLEDVTPERLNRLVDLEFSFEEIKVYISVGIYRISDPDENMNLMADKASTAALNSKGMHFKAIEYYSEDIDKQTAKNEQIKRDVELALKNNEIIPFFQPKVDIDTGLLVGAEALARWRTKDGQLISPGEFLPVCEQTGLITLIDMAIFQQTLQFLRENLDNGVQCVPISVNFSRLHLANRGFVNIVLDNLAHYKIPPELIELELTETVMFENSQLINEFVAALHEHGLKISMDDFGSGYSSLHMLKDIDIDVLKIDRGFLMGSSDNERQKAIFGSVVQMAQRLKIKVVVEGVETQDNVDLMREFNCSFAQGYFFGKPMEINIFRKIYTEGHI